MTKEELLQQLQINDSKVAEISNEIAKQKGRFDVTSRQTVKEFRLQLEYWAKDKKRINEQLAKIEQELR